MILFGLGTLLAMAGQKKAIEHADSLRRAFDLMALIRGMDIDEAIVELARYNPDTEQDLRDYGITRDRQRHRRLLRAGAILDDYSSALAAQAVLTAMLGPDGLYQLQKDALYFMWFADRIIQAKTLAGRVLNLVRGFSLTGSWKDGSQGLPPTWCTGSTRTPQRATAGRPEPRYLSDTTYTFTGQSTLVFHEENLLDVFPNNPESVRRITNLYFLPAELHLREHLTIEGHDPCPETALFQAQVQSKSGLTYSGPPETNFSVVPWSRYWYED